MRALWLRIMAVVDTTLTMCLLLFMVLLLLNMFVWAGFAISGNSSTFSWPVKGCYFWALFWGAVTSVALILLDFYLERRLNGTNNRKA